MFAQILEFSQTFVNNLQNFAQTILNLLGYEFQVGNSVYTLFDLLFTSAIVVVIIAGIVKFITNIIDIA